MKKFIMLIALLTVLRFAVAMEPGSPADIAKRVIKEIENIKKIADSITTKDEFDAINKIFKQIKFLSTCLEKSAKDNLQKDNEDYDAFKTDFDTCVNTHTTEMHAQLADATEEHPGLASATDCSSICKQTNDTCYKSCKKLSVGASICKSKCDSTYKSCKAKC